MKISFVELSTFLRYYEDLATLTKLHLAFALRHNSAVSWQIFRHEHGKEEAVVRMMEGLKDTGFLDIYAKGWVRPESDSKKS